MGIVLNFDATNVAPASPNEVIPAGWYPVMITGSDAKPTAAGDGSYLALEMDIVGGDYTGRKLFTNLNLQNPNPKAVEIAYRELSAICHAVGVIQCANSEQLHGRPLMAKVKVDAAGLGKDGKQYEARNSVSGFKAMEAGAVAGAATPAWAAPAATAPVVTTPPSAFTVPPVVKEAVTASPTPPWATPAAVTTGAAANTPPWAK